ncbi:MAG: apolipophorin [Burkholderiaceae bacterium]
MLNKSTVVILVAATLLIGLTACQKKDEYTGKGPAEQAGAEFDAAAAKAAEALNKAGEKAGQALQSAGEKGGEAVKKSGEKLEQASKDAEKK